ncbi:MAG: DUF1801 domain-containing protein [Chloroflexota bacterium]|nr:DUF1801 domain-containing protein [Chloroflexota bacterium]
MNSPALQTYLAGRGPKVASLVIALDQAIRTAHSGFDVAVKYKMLMYALGGDWRYWVCAIGETNKGICLRFLYGVLLDDPQGILRSGSSVLKTWDFTFDDVVDPAAVGAYVTEAVERYGEYTANAAEVLEASRAAAKAGRGPNASG